MAILKKIKSATLVEALMATVLIVVVFIIASLVLNNLLLNSFSKNTHSVENRIFELKYYAQYKSIQLPYHEEFGNWDIEVKEETTEGKKWLEATGINKINQKEIKKSVLCKVQK